jgi:hypothetical protein
MHVVMWDRDDESGDSAAGFRVLDPRQVVPSAPRIERSASGEAGGRRGDR